MRFFLDNCIAPTIAQALVILAEREGYSPLVFLRQKFAPDTPDVEWISQLGIEGDWVIVSGDPRISRGRHEREAWLESGLTAFSSPKGG